ncbi:MAG: hypothetical protein ABI467_04425, partial [Kofleriaceae bacterium]
EMPKLEKLAENPWVLVAFGALAGVWLGSHGARREQAEPRGLVMGIVGAIALKLVRDAALGQMTKIASQWLDIVPPGPVPVGEAANAAANPAYPS